MIKGCFVHSTAQEFICHMLLNGGKRESIYTIDRQLYTFDAEMNVSRFDVKSNCVRYRNQNCFARCILYSAY